MKYTCTLENILAAFESVEGIAEKKTNLPALAHILLRASGSTVDCTTTDLDMVATTKLRARVETEGAVAIPAKTAVDFLRSLSDEQVTVEAIGDTAVFTTNSSKTTIKGVVVEDFPVIPQNVGGVNLEVVNMDFKNALSQTVFAAARTEVRPELSGVRIAVGTERFEGMLLAATDSYRLVEKKINLSKKVETPCEVIVPVRAVQEMIRLLSLSATDSTINFLCGEGWITLSTSRGDLTARTVSGRYPDYAAIIPARFSTTVSLPLIDFTKKIKAAGLFSTSGVQSVALDVRASEGVCGISAMSAQTGEYHTTLESEISGGENSTVLNVRYVLEGIAHCSGDQVLFKLNDSQSPCVFQSPKDESFVYVVMPIRQ